MMPRRQHPRRDGLEGARPRTDGKAGHNQIHASGDKIDGGKDKERHPQHRKIEQPVAHCGPAGSSFAEDASPRHIKLLGAKLKLSKMPGWTPHELGPHQLRRRILISY